MVRAILAIAASLAAASCLAAGASAGPGNGKNAVFIFNDCSGGVGEVTLVSQASPSGLFATAHVVASNRPAPLISLDYELYIGGELIETGGYAHAHPQNGQPIVSCSGTFATGALVFVIEVTGFFPAGA
jgi:hypothetical protein